MKIAMSKLFRPNTEGKVVYIILLFLSISFILMTIIYVQGRVFDGVRSYVRGEGLWAKAQKDAVMHLDRYSFSFDTDDYDAFHDAVKVNLGDQRARLAMDRLPIDYEEATEGFLAGDNAPEDVDSMIWFYLNFQQIYYLQEAIRIWRDADVLIHRLIELATQIREKVLQKDSTGLEDLRLELYTLNDKLLLMENNFSQVLGEGARWVKSTTLIASIAILLLFVGTSIWISRQVIGGISRAEHRLRVSESRFRSLNESNTIGIISWTLEGQIEDANDYFLQMLGFSRKELRSGEVNWRSMTPPECVERDNVAIEELMRLGRCKPYEKELFNADGFRVPVYLGASLLDEYKDRGIAFFVNLREKKRQEEQLKLAAAVFDVSHDGIMMTDSDFRIISVNRAVIKMSGFSSEEMIGHRPAVLNSKEDKFNAIFTELQREGFWQGELFDHTKDGLILPVHISINSVKDREGKTTHYVLIFFDISESKAREDQLSHLANHDALTGLSNRNHLEQRLERAIGKSIENGTHFALLFFDLDRFKPVNDRYGHEVGDRLLQIVAERLSLHIRKCDTVARLGGDEFIILLESLDERIRAEEIAKKTLESLHAPTLISGHSIEISASVGISIYPDDGRDAKTLLEHADHNMYVMKAGPSHS